MTEQGIPKARRKRRGLIGAKNGGKWLRLTDPVRAWDIRTW